uniref:Uncharacterized protein n=1 Tax=Arundo donax TaxID=35708 RepID=A0A0A9A0V5_ARUDO
MAKIYVVQNLHAPFTGEDIGEDDSWEAWLVSDTGPKLSSNTIKLRHGFPSSDAAKLSGVNYMLMLLNAFYVCQVFLISRV